MLLNLLMKQKKELIMLLVLKEVNYQEDKSKELQ